MARRGKAKRAKRVATPAVAALAGLPPGADLLAAVAGLELSSLKGFDLPLVLRAVYRLGNHVRALLLDVVAEIMHRKDPDRTRADWDAVGVHEVRAALALTRNAANSLNHLAQDLHQRLPQVLQAMRDGRLDQPRARVFSSWTGLLSEAHARAVVDALLPIAPRLTTGELIDEIRRVAIELDPDFAQRSHNHGRSQRRVRAAIDTDGTGHITAEGLSAEQIAASCDRLDAIGWHLKRAGHPDKLDHIRADVFAGLLTGEFAGLTDEQLIEKLLATIPPTPEPSTSDTQTRSDNTDTTGEAAGKASPDKPDPTHQEHDDTSTGKTGSADQGDQAGTDEPGPTDDEREDGPADEVGSGDRCDGAGSDTVAGEADQRGDDAEEPDHPEPARADQSGGATDLSSDDGGESDRDEHGLADRLGTDRRGDDAVGPDGQDAGPADDENGGSADDQDGESPDDGPGGGPGRGPGPNPAGGGPSGPGDGAAAPTDHSPVDGGGSGPPPSLPPPTDSPPGAEHGPPTTPAGDSPPDPEHGPPVTPSRNFSPGPGHGPPGMGGHDADDDRDPDPDQGCDRRSGGGGGRVRLRRRGLRLWVGLGTIAGRDRRPGELLGWSLLHAEIARQVAAASGASWWYVLCDESGQPSRVGPIRRRPHRRWWDGPAATCQAVEVWLQVTATELAALLADPPPGWNHIITDIAHRVANTPAGAPNGDPADRFPSAGLRRFLAIRDRRCGFPGCRVPSHRTDVDHTTDYTKGGPTIDTNLTHLCRPDHQLKTKHGWQVEPIAPGHLRWTSPLGHVYQRPAPRGPARAQPPMPNPPGPEHDWFRPVTDEEYEDWFGTKPSTNRPNLPVDVSPTTCLTSDLRPRPGPPAQATPRRRRTIWEPEQESKRFPISPKPAPTSPSENDRIPF